MKGNWKKIKVNLDLISVVKSFEYPIKRKKKSILKEKAYYKADSLLQWLELADQIVKENVQEINDLKNRHIFFLEKIRQINSYSNDDNNEVLHLEELSNKISLELEECNKDNKFIYKELENLQQKKFLTDIKIENPNLADQLESIIDIRKVNLEKLKKNITDLSTIDEEKLWTLREKEKNKHLSKKSFRNEHKEIKKLELVSNLDSKKKQNFNNKKNMNIIEITKKYLGEFKITAEKEKDNDEKKKEEFLLFKKYLEEIEELGEKKEEIKNLCEELSKELEENSYGRKLLEILLKNWEKEKNLTAGEEDKIFLSELKKVIEEKKKELGIESLNDDKVLLEEQKEEIENFSGENTEESEEKDNFEENETASTSSGEVSLNLDELEFEKKKENAQQWFDSNFEEKKKYKQYIYNEKNDEKIILEGELVIKDYINLEEIHVREGGELTKLSIENCPKLKLIWVPRNKIEEINGLENLNELNTLNVSKNKITELNVSKNINLEQLFYIENKDIKIIGLQNLSRLSQLSGEYNLKEMTKEELIDLAESFGINKEKLNDKNFNEIKEVAKEEKEKIQKNNFELKQLSSDLFDDEGRIIENKVLEIKEQIKRGKEYLNLVKKNQLLVVDEKIDQKKINKLIKSAKKSEKIKGEAEYILGDTIGSSLIQTILENDLMKKKLEEENKLIASLLQEQKS